MTFAKLIATGSYLPNKVLSNNDLEQFLETSDEWINTRTGIRQRHIAETIDTTTSMAISSAKQALKKSKLKPKDIDLIIVATCTPDKMFPSTACLVQEALKINNCPAFDISVACSGFLYALVTAQQFIANGPVKNALVIGSEVMSKILDWQDRATCVLFGDGAGACILSASEEPGILASELKADGSKKDILELNNGSLHGDYYLRMQGSLVYKHAVKVLGDVAEAVVEKAGLSPKEIDWLVPHQANLRIIKATAKRLGIDMEKVITCVDKHANTSAASIPLALDTAINDAKIQPGQNLLLEAVGGGLTWGAIVLRY